MNQQLNVEESNEERESRLIDASQVYRTQCGTLAARLSTAQSKLDNPLDENDAAILRTFSIMVNNSKMTTTKISKELRSIITHQTKLVNSQLGMVQINSDSSLEELKYRNDLIDFYGELAVVSFLLEKDRQKCIGQASADAQPFLIQLRSLVGVIFTNLEFRRIEEIMKNERAMNLDFTR
jgi:hypothetical protein